MPWPHRDSNQPASGKPGAVQTAPIRLVGLVLCFLFSFADTLAAEDPNVAADRLLQEAVRLAQEAKRAPSPAEALNNYRIARAALDRIIEEYPSSRLAVQLALGDPLMRRLDVVIKGEEAAERCWRSPTRECVLGLALDTVRSTEDALFRAQALAVIAAALDSADHFEAALDAAGGIENAMFRAEALVGIAAAQAAAGDSSAARDTFAAALDTTLGIENTLVRSEALVGIASAQAVVGDNDAVRDMLAAALGIPPGENASGRAHALAAIAAALE